MSGSFVVAVSDDDGSCSVGGNDSSGAFTSLLEKVVLAQGSLFVCELVQRKSCPVRQLGTSGVCSFLGKVLTKFKLQKYYFFGLVSIEHDYFIIVTVCSKDKPEN